MLDWESETCNEIMIDFYRQAYSSRAGSGEALWYTR